MSPSTTTDRILVPLDGTWVGMSAMPWLRAVATDATELVLLRAVSLRLPVAGYAPMAAESYDAIARQTLEGAEAYLDAVAEEIADVTTKVTKVATINTVPDAILAKADEQSATMILMATEGRGAVGRLFIGSVADMVARAATVPVLLVPARVEDDNAPYINDAAPIGRLVVPFDGSNLARNAFPVAEDLARHLDVPIHLVRVVPTPAQMTDQLEDEPDARHYVSVDRSIPVPTRPAIDREWYEGYVESVRGALASEASQLAATGVEADGEVRIGETMPQLLEVLASDDMVVMTSHGEGGIRRWMMGSVAEQLIHQAVAPVTLVPAPGRERIPG